MSCRAGFSDGSLLADNERVFSLCGLTFTKIFFHGNLSLNLIGE